MGMNAEKIEEAYKLLKKWRTLDTMMNSYAQHCVTLHAINPNGIDSKIVNLDWETFRPVVEKYCNDLAIQVENFCKDAVE